MKVNPCPEAINLKLLNEKMIARIFRIASYLDDPMNVVKFYKLNAISLNDDKAPTANSSSQFETDESVSLFTNTIESIRKLLLKQKKRLQV